MADGIDLDRFVQAQSATYAQALAELNAGMKRSHWIWFIFPQLRGLGHSETARFFGLRSADEARAYLAHPVLGIRLHQCCAALMQHRGKRAEAMLGTIDTMKLRSSMTLFEAVADDPAPFAAVLNSFHQAARDPLTLALLCGRT